MFTFSVSHQTQAKRLKAYPSFRRVRCLCPRSFWLLCFWGLIAVTTKSVELHKIGRGLLFVSHLHLISFANKSWNRNLDLNIQIAMDTIFVICVNILSLTCGAAEMSWHTKSILMIMFFGKSLLQILAQCDDLVIEKEFPPISWIMSQFQYQSRW